MNSIMLKNPTLVLVITTLGLFACQKSTLPEESTMTADSTFTNPLLTSGADPWAIFHEGNYYYIKSEAGKIILMRTPDITDLQHAEQHTVWTAPPNTDHSKNVWAPEIHNIDDHWYIYVAADDGDNRNHRMFVLENTAPDPFSGSFELKNRIKTDEGDNWAIDGSVFEHRDTLYFIWSGWQQPKPEGGEETQRIYIARLSNPWTIASDRVELSQPELAWERNWDYPEPVFQQSPENGVYGTGHNSFFKSPDGTEDWILYHANDHPADGCSDRRSPRAQRIRWMDDDTPIFGEPLPTAQPIRKPSGTLAE